MDELLKLAEEGNGYIATESVSRAGIPRRILSEAVAAGKIVKVDRGLYALPHVWEDPYFIVQHRYSRGIFSDDTSLFLLGRTDRAPFYPTMTFPRSYNASAVRRDGITCRTCSDDVFELGLTTTITPYGNNVSVYDLERTLCDLLRGQQVIDSQVVAPAMRAYVRNPKRNIGKLMQYARSLGVERKIRTYLEALQ